MAIGSKILKIAAGDQFSEILTIPWEINIGIAYITTQDTILPNSKLELYIQSKKDNSVWLPLYNPTTEENASIGLIPDKVIPCSPYVDGRGAKAIKFGITNIHSSDIFLEVGLVNF